jgi:hypothetical protein
MWKPCPTVGWNNLLLNFTPGIGLNLVFGRLTQITIITAAEDIL